MRPGENDEDINSVKNMKLAIRSVSLINYSERKLLKGGIK
jgi:hypothetical protein